MNGILYLILLKIVVAAEILGESSIRIAGEAGSRPC